ncbi:hypothetical protein F0562_003361 [Nyssa sinensis]|uniref:Root meristem growth factor 9 n=1 Tax=Nyssa sinensis TaxID=561372 RepID=A0A5J5BZ75_9ASTE|nr:hypothetical protein F0562_003361 [Nyssa sinensis]
MAMVACRRLVLVAFLLLCFIFITARARSLRTDINGAEKGHDMFIPKEDGVPDSTTEELVAMDYTPATKKPPIHN